MITMTAEPTTSLVCKSGNNLSVQAILDKGADYITTCTFIIITG